MIEPIQTLKKDICINCINKYANTNKFYDKWNKHDEDNWEKGKIFCICYSFMRIKTKTFKETLDDCPYKLEHINQL
jgi:hypothetical protein